ncbi:MAG: hypothetical protein QOI59_3859 [Gammaproteobacteria bacterium]|nr:hypothetical protein [Gammaproteobacteria bacterium]
MSLTTWQISITDPVGCSMVGLDSGRLPGAPIFGQDTRLGACGDPGEQVPVRSASTAVRILPGMRYAAIGLHYESAQQVFECERLAGLQPVQQV